MNSRNFCTFFKHFVKYIRNIFYDLSILFDPRKFGAFITLKPGYRIKILNIFLELLKIHKIYYQFEIKIPRISSCKWKSKFLNEISRYNFLYVNVKIIASYGNI